MAVHSLSPDKLKQLEDNQKECENLGMVTERATFRLSKLLALIDEIQKTPGFKSDTDFLHNICITFVRMECGDPEESRQLKENELGFYDTDGLLEYCQANNGKYFTQVVPIITGCIAEFADKAQTITNKEGKKIEVKYKGWLSFDHLKNGKDTPYLRPGGETSGLIPPPPPPNG